MNVWVLETYIKDLEVI